MSLIITDINHLLSEEINHELKRYNIDGENKNLDVRRNLLKEAMVKERKGMLRPLDPSDEAITQEERHRIFKIGNELLVRSANFNGGINTRDYYRIDSRVRHYQRRIIYWPENNQKHELIEILNQCKENIDDSAVIGHEEEEIVERKEPEVHLYVKMPLSKSGLTESTENNFGRDPKLYKWGIKYNGHNMSVEYFLEQVQVFSSSRNVTDDELFRCAPDLLEGSAYLWYMANKINFKNWVDFKNQLISNFGDRDLDLKLLRTLMNTYQGPNETSVEYISKIKILYNRMYNKLPVELITQLSISNAKPEYRALLNFNNCQNLDEVQSCLKQIEIGDRRIGIGKNEFPITNQNYFDINQHGNKYKTPKQQMYFNYNNDCDKNFKNRNYNNFNIRNFNNLNNNRNYKNYNNNLNNDRNYNNNFNYKDNNNFSNKSYNNNDNTKNFNNINNNFIKGNLNKNRNLKYMNNNNFYNRNNNSHLSNNHNYSNYRNNNFSNYYRNNKFHNNSYSNNIQQNNNLNLNNNNSSHNNNFSNIHNNLKTNISINKTQSNREGNLNTLNNSAGENKTVSGELLKTTAIIENDFERYIKIENKFSKQIENSTKDYYRLKDLIEQYSGVNKDYLQFQEDITKNLILLDELPNITDSKLRNDKKKLCHKYTKLGKDLENRISRTNKKSAIDEIEVGDKLGKIDKLINCNKNNRDKGKSMYSIVNIGKSFEPTKHIQTPLMGHEEIAVKVQCKETQYNYKKKKKKSINRLELIKNHNVTNYY